MNKADRKELIEQCKENEKKNFLDSLPISKELFQELFNFLDAQLGESGCDHSFDLTTAFIQRKKINVASVIDWIIENGQGCDCEVLNLEDHFLK